MPPFSTELKEERRVNLKRLDSTPKADGFRMPGEFEPHRGCYMIWPERPDNWRLGGKPAQKVFTEVASVIGKYEQMTMIVSADQYANARGMLPDYVRVVECLMMTHG